MVEYFGFSIKIVSSDKFMSMSPEAQTLYFHLSSSARNKGILINTKMVCRSLGLEEEFISELEKNEFIYKATLESIDCYIITHWYENNGIGDVAKKRITKPYRDWRMFVLNRDHSKCKKCGSEKDLCVHHILPFSEYPTKRFDVDNGITLCASCHKEIHKKRK